MTSAETFKESLKSVLKHLSLHHITSMDPIATMFIWQLLPVKVQHLMAGAPWRRDLVATKAASPRCGLTGTTHRPGAWYICWIVSTNSTFQRRPLKGILFQRPSITRGASCGLYGACHQAGGCQVGSAVGDVE